MLFICCEIKYLVHGSCDQIILYCSDENYYHAIDKSMGILTKRPTLLLFTKILCYNVHRKFTSVIDHIYKLLN